MVTPAARLDDMMGALRAILDDAVAGKIAPGYRVSAGTTQRFVYEVVARLEDGGFARPLWLRGLILEANQRYIDAVRVPSTRTKPWQVACAVAEADHVGTMRN